jgi:hypothetical protein
MSAVWTLLGVNHKSDPIMSLLKAATMHRLKLDGVIGPTNSVLKSLFAEKVLRRLNNEPGPRWQCGFKCG